LLGAALLKAERVYRDELTDHPLNGWSLLGLQTLCRHKARNTTRSMPNSAPLGVQRTFGSTNRGFENNLD
jgi:hypothetical protein